MAGKKTKFKFPQHVLDATRLAITSACTDVDRGDLRGNALLDRLESLYFDGFKHGAQIGIGTALLSPEALTEIMK